MTNGLRRGLYGVVGLVVVAGLGGTAYVTRDRWQPLLAKATAKPASEEHSEGDGHDHASHGGDDHGGEAAAGRLTLSDQARRNLGLELAEVELTDYWRTVQIPGVVSEQPGHSERRIPATLAGVVTKLHVFSGQSVKPGDPLLDLQPTGEQLSTAQSSLLKTLQDLELVNLELQRITPLVENGSLPAKNKIEKEYERKRLESQQLIETQELSVRGLSRDQIGRIIETKTLIRQFTVYVPGAKPNVAEPSARTEPPGERERIIPVVAIVDEAPNPAEAGNVYTVEKIEVFPGKLVQPGEEMVDLAFHTILNIEGMAFERESPLVRQAMQERWAIRAEFETVDGQPLVRDDLKIRYIDNSVDGATRIQKFHLRLLNKELKEVISEDGSNFHIWTFKPGQYVRLFVPIEHLPERIVLPAEAVAKDGVDAYVFRVNGKRLERTAVRVEHLDSRQAVIKNDGTLTPGFDVVAKNQAYQLNLELKKKSGEGGGGGGHEGHNH